MTKRKTSRAPSILGYLLQLKIQGPGLDITIMDFVRRPASERVRKIAMI